MLTADERKAAAKQAPELDGVFGSSNRDSDLSDGIGGLIGAKKQPTEAPRGSPQVVYQARKWTHAELRPCQPWAELEVGRSLEEGRDGCQLFVQVSNKHVSEICECPRS
jgi:hypothetical protein